MRHLPILARLLLANLLLAGPAWSATHQPIAFANGSAAWGQPYAIPAATRDGPLVVLSGVLRVARNGHVATLPVGMRPAQDILLRQTKGTYAIPIDIQTDGRIFAGGNVGNWVSLDGLAFTTQLAEHLPLESGATNYGERFGSPRAWKHYDLVVLSGLVRAKHGLLTILPAHMRPAEHQIIGVRSEGGTARIDVHPNGHVVWQNGPGGWISLAGVNFPTRLGTQLPVGPGYAHYTDSLAGDFGKARALQMGDFTIPSGLLIGLHPGVAVTLPDAMRTAESRLLAGFAGAGTPAENADVRLDLANTGQLNHSEAGPSGGWLSLAGPVFVRGAAGQAAAPPQPAPDSTLAQQTLNELKGLDWSLSPKLVTQLDRIATHAMTQEGTVFKARLSIANQQVEVVIYRPAPGAQLEVAFLTDDLSVGNLIGALEGTEIDDFRVTKAAFIFVAKDNARTATLASLPAPIQQRLQGLTWSTFELVAGQNLVGRLHARFSGPFADVVRETGICGDGGGCPVQVDVQASYGRRAAEGCRAANKRNTKGWRVRMTRPGVWQGFFGLSGVDLTNATMEIAKEQNQTLVRAWSDEATVDDGRGNRKSYFLFGQCVTRNCKGQNAFAISAKSLSLQDYRTLMTKVASRVIGSDVGEWQGGLDRLPLNLVSVEHRDGYDPAQNVDPATRNPRFGTMLGYFVGPNQSVPSGDAACLAGTELYVNGKGRVFGAQVGELTAKWHRAQNGKKARIEADGRLTVPSWSTVLQGDLDFRLRRESGDHSMSLYGQFSVAGLGTPQVRLDIDRQHMLWRSGSSCPGALRAEIEADLDLVDKTPRIAIVPDFDASCIQDLFNTIWNGARAGVGVASNHVEKGLLALGELGTAGVRVIEDSIEEGWDSFNDNLKDGAKEAGQTLSDGAQTLINDASDTDNYNPTNWIP